jgi:hypothetical protein
MNTRRAGELPSAKALLPLLKQGAATGVQTGDMPDRSNWAHS